MITVNNPISPSSYLKPSDSVADLQIQVVSIGKVEISGIVQMRGGRMPTMRRGRRRASN